MSESLEDRGLNAWRNRDAFLMITHQNEDDAELFLACYRARAAEESAAKAERSKRAAELIAVISDGIGYEGLGPEGSGKPAAAAFAALDELSRLVPSVPGDQGYERRDLFIERICKELPPCDLNSRMAKAHLLKRLAERELRIPAADVDLSQCEPPLPSPPETK